MPTTAAATTAAVDSGAGAGTLQSAYVAVVRRILPSVVQIETSHGLGSGIVYDAQGDIVTNNHVIAGATSVAVTTSTGKKYQGTLVGTFAPDDLAVIHVNNATLTPASFADSSKLEVGDIVMAVGNPLGLQSSVTAGITSATGRTVSEDNGVVLPDTIQTSAEINPGNSGGALVDLNASVVGIPTLGAVDQQLGGSAPGIGFAIPSNMVTSIASQLVRGVVSRTRGAPTWACGSPLPTPMAHSSRASRRGAPQPTVACSRVTSSPRSRVRRSRRRVTSTRRSQSWLPVTGWPWESSGRTGSSAPSASPWATFPHEARPTPVTQRRRRWAWPGSRSSSLASSSRVRSNAAHTASLTTVRRRPFSSS